MKNFKRLEGKTAIVTGAARGLGKALAQRLSDEGANVVVADLNYDGAVDTASKLSQATPVKVDITKLEECEAMAKAAIDKYGKIDILVCNAAITFSGPIEALSTEKVRKVLDVNICGVYNSIKAAVPFMKKDGGSIIQINSKSGKKGSFKNSAYAASKFGGIGLVQSLALEFAPNNVRVNAICPGNLLDSPLWTGSLYKQYAKNQGITEQEVRQKYIDQVPLKRGCTYDDVANVAVFFASEESSYMTGQAINVTGGQQMV